MPVVQPDFSESFPQMTPGIYICTIASCDLRTSKNGNRYISWKLETEQDKHTVYYTTMVEGRGSGMLKHFIRCALDPSYEGGGFNTDDLIGKHLVAHLGIKEIESNGKRKSVYEVKQIEQLLPDQIQTLNSEEDIPF